MIIYLIYFYFHLSISLLFWHSTAQDTSFRQEIEQSPELGLLILDAMQEAEIDSSTERLKKRRRITETGVDTNTAALVPRQVNIYP